MKKMLFEVYLINGQSFKMKCEDIHLEWDGDGKVTGYNFKGHKPNGPLLAMPPQSIIGVRKIR